VINTGLKWKTQFKAGVGHGLALATLYSAYVLIVAALGGRAHVELGVPLGTIIAFYYLGGAVAGLIYGALAPIAKWTMGRACLGFLIMFPIGAGCMYLLPDGGLNDRGDWIAAVVFAGLLGGLGGLHFLDPAPDRTEGVGPVVQIMAALTVLIVIVAVLM